jgi:hypothetical protein
VFDPIELRGSLWNRQSTGGVYHFDCFLDACSGYDEQAGCYQAGAPNALAAMDGDVLTLVQRGCDVAQQ